MQDALTLKRLGQCSEQKLQRLQENSGRGARRKILKKSNRQGNRVRWLFPPDFGTGV